MRFVKQLTRSQLVCTFFYFSIFLICYKLLIPYGDEPDFSERINRLGNTQFSKVLDLDNLPTKNLIEKIHYNCSINYSRTDLRIVFKPACIKENFANNFIKRIFFTIFNIIFLLGLLKFFFWFFKIKISEKQNETFYLTALFPFVIYVISFTSQEFYVHALSLCLFLNPFIVKLSILLLIYFLEYDGQFIVCLLYIIIFYLNNFLLRMIKLKPLQILLLNISTITILHMVNFEYFSRILQPSIFSSKIKAIIDSNFQDTKYNLLLRFIFTIFTLSFMTANGIKFLLTPLFLLWRFLKPKVTEIESFSLIHLISACSTIAIVLAILPQYTYGKYYLFLIPVVLEALISIYRFTYIKNVLIQCNFINILFLIFILYA